MTHWVETVLRELMFRWNARAVSLRAESHVHVSSEFVRGRWVME